MTLQLIGVCALLSFLEVLQAQPTRTEVTKATTPADDSKANSDKVPDVYAVSGQFERVLVLRFKYQADLLAGLEKMVNHQKILNPAILPRSAPAPNYHTHS